MREWTQQVRPYNPQKEEEELTYPVCERKQIYLESRQGILLKIFQVFFYFVEFKVKVAPDPQSESPVVAEKILFPS